MRPKFMKTAVALFCVLLDPVSAGTLAVRQQKAAPLPSIWITVDGTGSARTVTPSLTVSNGATVTVSPPPDQLTRLQTWKMTYGNVVTTATTMAPVATATPTGSSESGAMLVCKNPIGPDPPFCYPYRGSLLNPGTTYYFTWDPNYFGWNLSQLIEVQANYDGGLGWLSPKIPASVGYYAWKVPEDVLEVRGQTATNLTWYINYQDEDGSNSWPHIPGPTVTITKEKMLIDDGLPKGGEASPLSVVVAVPVVLALAILGLGGFCFWSWRKKGIVPGAAAIVALKRRSTGSGAGYGERRSRAERAGQQPGGEIVPPGAAGLQDRLPDDKLPGIQLTDRDSWSPASPSSGRNVFQEEIRRQETGRQ